MLKVKDVEAAAARITGRVRRTPVIEAEGAAFGVDLPVLLKLESLQHTGSFKPRGVFNRLLTAIETSGIPEAGVICASGGNAGLAVAYAARELGLHAEIFVPQAASPVKVQRLRTLGADVVIAGAFYADAYNACLERSNQNGALLVHAYDQPEVVAGQGTLGLELLDQVGKLDTLLVAVGGGGLIGGITAAIGKSTKIVAVEPELIPTLHAAMEFGAPVDVEVSGLAAESLGAKRIGSVAFEVTQETAIHSVLVSDDSIRTARQRLWEEFRLATEYGGATALAALINGAYRPVGGERIGVVVCGANTDPGDLVARQ